MNARSILFTVAALALSVFAVTGAQAQTYAQPNGVLDDCIRPNICDFLPHWCDDGETLPGPGQDIWRTYARATSAERLDMAVAQLRTTLGLRPFEANLLDRLAYAPDAQARWAALEDIRLLGLEVNPGLRSLAGAVRSSENEAQASSDGGASNVIAGAGLGLAILVAVADGPLPFGDAVAAVIIGGIAGKAINDALEEE